MVMALNAGADQKAADRLRIEQVGTIGYCPVCRRPASVEPIPAGDAMARVAAHLVEAHDPYFATMLRLRLEGAARDPFYPTGDAL